MEGEVLFPKKNRFVTLQFPSNARSVVCQDVFDRVVTFPRVYWIGDALQNPEETPLPLPPEITIATAPLASMPWGPRIGVRPEEEDVAHDDMETTVASSKGKRTPRQRQRRRKHRLSDAWDSSDAASEEPGEEEKEDEDEEEEENEEEVEVEDEVTPSRTPQQTPKQRSTPTRAASQRARRQLLNVMASNSVGSDSSDLEILDVQPTLNADRAEGARR
ncbi:hypothetical protein PINS_up022999 [Pythium insidiosum]|nr:hypothetical protein PINS_up022999 [Pythium insidiosum]